MTRIYADVAWPMIESVWIPLDNLE